MFLSSAFNASFFRNDICVLLSREDIFSSREDLMVAEEELDITRLDYHEVWCCFCSFVCLFVCLFVRVLCKLCFVHARFLLGKISDAMSVVVVVVVVVSCFCISMHIVVVHIYNQLNGEHFPSDEQRVHQKCYWIKRDARKIRQRQQIRSAFHRLGKFPAAVVSAVIM